MPWMIGAVNTPVTDLIRLLHQMFKVLEGILEPFHARQCQGHVHTQLEKGVAHRDLRAHVRSQPADAHHVGDMAMYVQQVANSSLEKLALTGEIKIFTCIDEGGSALVLDELQPGEVIAQDWIFYPKDLVPCALHQDEI